MRKSSVNTVALVAFVAIILGITALVVSAQSSDCCSRDALKKIASSAGFIDLPGIKLGMTPEQAWPYAARSRPASARSLR